MNVLASKMINFLSAPSKERASFLLEIYGRASEEKLLLYINAIKQFIEIFGDQPVVISRAPGRVNLRGMHVDTHGGFLNLMSLDREIVVVSAPSNDGYLRVYNSNPIHKPLIISLNDFLRNSNSGDLSTKGEYGGKDKAQSGLFDHPGNHWHRYILGSTIQLSKELNKFDIKGMNAVVSGDIPDGCSLSSSHALCISVLLALEASNSINLDTITKIKMVQKAEWFAGARSGFSDQVAELMCKKRHILGVQLNPFTAEILEQEQLSMPEHLTVVVANSNQKRDISSTHSAEYVKNRFAYSLAIDLLKRIMPIFGFTSEQIDSFRTFRDFTLDRIGGAGVLYEMFKQLPNSVPIEEVKTIVGEEKFKELYATYFSHLPEDVKPKQINIRGAVAYGICENFRARAFFEAMKNGDYVLAGYLMNLGHNGDRVIDYLGYPYIRKVTDDILFVYRDLRIDPITLPGDYGASTPVLDRMVDIANEAGALGSSLTGAGLGGAIVSLCLVEDAPAIIAALRNWLGTEEYLKLSKRDKPLSQEEIKNSVFENTTSRPAGLVKIPELVVRC